MTEVGPKYIGKQFGHSTLGVVYSSLAVVLIPTVSGLFLKLYFLPANQSVPPRDPPSDITLKKVVYECLPPAEAAAVREANNEPPSEEPLVNRCWKGKCAGRWKPARARHCSECGTCRAGFDHHCAFVGLNPQRLQMVTDEAKFANCLTAPHIPTFLCLLTWTPPTIILLSSPLYLALARRATQAWSVSWSDPSIRLWWYEWRWSWAIAGGPVGRYMGGLVLGWKAIDRADGGGSLRLEIGVLVGIGLILAMITTVSSPSTAKADIQALVVATASLVTKGHLTVDRERYRSQARAKAAIAHLRDKGRVITPDMLANLERWSQRHYYYVPRESGHGKIVELELGDHPYDLGDGANWTVIMGRGWGWLLPWQAVRRGMRDEIFNWPLSPAALTSLRSSQHS